jgi:lipopolysaccharide transport system permease protein
MVGIIDGFRWAILGIDQDLNYYSIAISVGIVLAVNIFALWYFIKSERKFADII